MVHVEEAARMREALAQAKRETAAAARDGILAHVEEAARARQEHAEAKRVTATAMDDMLQHLEQAARERAEHTEAKRQIADVKQQMLAEVLTQRTALRPAPPRWKIRKAWPLPPARSRAYWRRRRRKAVAVSASAAQLGSQGVRKLRLSRRSSAQARQSSGSGGRSRAI